MTDKVQKIREEIERLFNHVKDSNFESDSGAFYYLKDLLDFIDSLQEKSVSEELIDVAKQYVKEYVIGIDKVTFSIATDMFISGANWQKQQDQETIELAEDHAMLAGMEKMKEEMMAKAINAVISQVPCSNEIILYNPSSVDKYYLPQEMNKLGLNKGDKVKVIIIKED